MLINGDRTYNQSVVKKEKEFENDFIIVFR